MHAHKGMKSVWLVASCCTGFALGLCGTGWAETPKAHVYTLDACIQKALEFSPRWRRRSRMWRYMRQRRIRPMARIS
jgi:hypothetical protein